MTCAVEYAFDEILKIDCKEYYRWNNIIES